MRSDALREWVTGWGGAWVTRVPGVAASLAEVGGVKWPVLVELDHEFGGLSLQLDERELWVGLDSALEMPGFRKRFDGARLHVLIGAFSPNGFYVDETGAVLEVDGDGKIVRRAQSLRSLLEAIRERHPVAGRARR